jgi:hypothetical protein
MPAYIHLAYARLLAGYTYYVQDNVICFSSPHQMFGISDLNSTRLKPFFLVRK